MKKLIFVFLAVAGLSACESGPATELSAFSDAGVLQAYIETPAGSTHPMRYQPSTGKIVADTSRSSFWLPAPGNLGFIPSTDRSQLAGYQGQALPVLVVSAPAKPGALLPVRLIGTIMLQRKGNVEPLLVAIPEDPALRCLPAADFKALSIRYQSVKFFIEHWALDAAYPGEVELLEWRDEGYGRSLVEKYLVQMSAE